MYRTVGGRHLLRLGSLVAFVVLVVSACGRGGDEEAKAARPLPEAQQALRPGTYSSEEFKPAFTFQAVDKEWETIGIELRDALSLAQGNSVLNFLNVEKIHKPTRTGTPNVVDAPKDLAAWFQQHPYLHTEEPEPVTIGGVKGVEFDVIVSDLPKDYYGLCGSDCVDLIGESSGGGIYVDEEEKGRIVAVAPVEHVIAPVKIA